MDNKKLKKARAQLAIIEPFFGYLAMTLKWTRDDTCDTMWTDGIEIGYSPLFVEQTALGELIGVIAHEILHVVMYHHTRRNNRDAVKWNMACDYAINPIVLSHNISLPEGCLYNLEYIGKSAEAIFKLLPNENNGNSKQNNTTDGSKSNPAGEIRDLPKNTEIDTSAHIAKLKRNIQNANRISQKAGRGSAGLQRIIDYSLEPKVCWKSILADYLQDIVNTDYNWQRPDTRFSHTGFILPSIISENIGEIIIIVDTSCSVSEADLNQFAAEALSIVEEFQINIRVIYVDSKVCGTDMIEPGNAVNLTPKGGGGTSFKPGFEYIADAKNDCDPLAVIYYTDGECSDHPDEPEYPVIWAITDTYYRYENKVPWGKVVEIV